MRYIVLTTAMAFIGGLFTASLVLGAGESQWGSESQKQQEKYGSSAQQGQQQMAGQQLDQKTVREMQKKLNEEGFNAGPEDGIMGPKTRSALQEFQREEDLVASGQPDQETLEALDIDVEGQEFFGVSPEFGEEQQKSQEEQRQQEQQQQQPYHQQQQQQQPGSGSMETR